MIWLNPILKHRLCAWEFQFSTMLTLIISLSLSLSAFVCVHSPARPRSAVTKYVCVMFTNELCQQEQELKHDQQNGILIKIITRSDINFFVHHFLIFYLFIFLFVSLQILISFLHKHLDDLCNRQHFKIRETVSFRLVHCPHCQPISNELHQARIRSKRYTVSMNDQKKIRHPIICNSLHFRYVEKQMFHSFRCDKIRLFAHVQKKAQNALSRILNRFP